MWLIIIVLCCIHLYLLNRTPKWFFSISRLLPIAFILGDVVTNAQLSTTATLLLSLGLLCAALGDSLLFGTEKTYTPGFIALLSAHLAFFGSFVSQLHHEPTLWLSVVVVSISVIIYLLLLPVLGERKLPVAAYLITICLTIWATTEYWINTHSQSAFFGLLGGFALIFYGILISTRRSQIFGRYSPYIITLSYFAAQTLLAFAI